MPADTGGVNNGACRLEPASSILSEIFKLPVGDEKADANFRKCVERCMAEATGAVFPREGAHVRPSDTNRYELESSVHTMRNGKGGPREAMAGAAFNNETGEIRSFVAGAETSSTYPDKAVWFNTEHSKGQSSTASSEMRTLGQGEPEFMRDLAKRSVDFHLALRDRIQGCGLDAEMERRARLDAPQPEPDVK